MVTDDHSLIIHTPYGSIAKKKITNQGGSVQVTVTKFPIIPSVPDFAVVVMYEYGFRMAILTYYYYSKIDRPVNRWALINGHTAGCYYYTQPQLHNNIV